MNPKFKRSLHILNFIAIDLELRSMSPLNLLIKEFGEGVSAQHKYCCPVTGEYHLSLGCIAFPSTLERTVNMLCQRIEKFSTKAKKAWDCAHLKDFDIGVDIMSYADRGVLKLPNKTLERIASVGASILLTCYLRTPEEGKDKPAPSKKTNQSKP